MTTDTFHDIDENVLQRVRALLAKAESTDFAEEAEAFTAKAQELMARHSIADALVADAGRGDPAGPEASEITVEDPYARSKFRLLANVAVANRCRAVYSPDDKTATVVGWPGDRLAVDALYTSLLVQGAAELQRTGSVRDVWGRNRTRSYRNSFWAGFAMTVGDRLAAATRAAEAEATRERGDVVLPVLARRAEAVDERVHQLFPRLTSMRSSITNHDGWHAGQVAGERAELRPRRQVRGRSR